MIRQTESSGFYSHKVLFPLYYTVSPMPCCPPPPEYRTISRVWKHPKKPQLAMLCDWHYRVQKPMDYNFKWGGREHSKCLKIPLPPSLLTCAQTFIRIKPNLVIIMNSPWMVAKGHLSYVTYLPGLCVCHVLACKPNKFGPSPFQQKEFFSREVWDGRM